MTITKLPRPGSGRWSEARCAQFSVPVNEVVTWMHNYVAQIGFAPVARPYLYARDFKGIITKGDFSWASKWLADRRKEGFIPFELVGEDTTRQLTGHETYDEEAALREYINRQQQSSLEHAGMYWPSSYWEHEEHFPIIWSEKLDVLKLFKPETPAPIRRFCGKGQTFISGNVAGDEALAAALQQQVVW